MQAANEHLTPSRNRAAQTEPLLTSARLRLEPLTMTHFEDMYYLNNDMRVMQYITGRNVSIDETLSHIQLVGRNWKDFGYSSWAIFEMATNDFIGSCGIQHIEFNPANPVEFGWRLKPEKWGQGLATEAARCMIQFVNEHTSIESLHAVCHQDNKKSRSVMERLGMHYCGLSSWYGLEVHDYKVDRNQYADAQHGQPVPCLYLSSEKILREGTAESYAPASTAAVNTNS